MGEPTSGLKIVFKAPIVSDNEESDDDVQSDDPMDVDDQVNSGDQASSATPAPLIKLNLSAPASAVTVHSGGDAESSDYDGGSGSSSSQDSASASESDGSAAVPTVKLLFKPKAIVKAPKPQPSLVVTAPAEPEPAPAVNLVVSKPRPPTPEKVYVPLSSLLRNLLEQIAAKHKETNYDFFCLPVDPTLVPDYYDVIKHPMDLQTIGKRIDGTDEDLGKYSEPQEFRNDIELMCRNAMLYNAPNTVFFQEGKRVQDLSLKLIDTAVASWEPPPAVEAGDAKTLPNRTPTQPAAPAKSKSVAVNKHFAKPVKQPARSLNGRDVIPYVNPALAQLKQSIATPTAHHVYGHRGLNAVPLPGTASTSSDSAKGAGNTAPTAPKDHSDKRGDKYVKSVHSFLKGTGLDQPVADQIVFGSSEVLAATRPATVAGNDALETQLGEWGSHPILARDIRLLLRPDAKAKGEMAQIATKFTDSEVDSLLAMEKDLGLDVSFLKDIFNHADDSVAADVGNVDHLLDENFDVLYQLQASLHKRPRTEKPSEGEKQAAALLADHLGLLVTALPPGAVVSKQDARAAIRNLCGAYTRPPPPAKPPTPKSAPHAGSVQLSSSAGFARDKNQGKIGGPVPPGKLSKAVPAPSHGIPRQVPLVSQTLQYNGQHSLSTGDVTMTDAQSTPATKVRKPPRVIPGQKCSNCGTTETPGWRAGPTPEERLCNACGLYWAKNKPQHRPVSLWSGSSGGGGGAN